MADFKVTPNSQLEIENAGGGRARQSYGIGGMLVSDPNAFPHLMKNSPAFSAMYNHPDSQWNMNALMTILMQKGLRPTPKNVEFIANTPEFAQMTHHLKTGAAREKLAALLGKFSAREEESDSSSYLPAAGLAASLGLGLAGRHYYNARRAAAPTASAPLVAASPAIVQALKSEAPSSRRGKMLAAAGVGGTALLGGAGLALKKLLTKLDAAGASGAAEFARAAHPASARGSGAPAAQTLLKAIQQKVRRIEEPPGAKTLTLGSPEARITPGRNRMVRIEEPPGAKTLMLGSPESRLSPSRQRLTEIEERLSPSRQRGIPIEERLSPSRQRLTEIEERLSPSRQRGIPIEERLSPSRQRGIPIEERLSPSRQRVTEIEERLSPSRQRGIPVEERLSPVRQRGILLEDQRPLAASETPAPVLTFGPDRYYSHDFSREYAGPKRSGPRVKRAEDELFLFDLIDEARAKLAALYKTANLQDHASSSSGVAPVVTSRGGGPGAPLAAPPSSPYPISVAPAPAKMASLSSSPLAAIAFRAFAPRLAMSLR
jgi:hypothetical protein